MRCFLVAVPFAAGPIEQEEYQCDPETAGQTNGIMQRQEPGKGESGDGRRPVVERCVRVGAIGQVRCQPVATLQHVGNNADGDCVVVLPGIVADQTGQNEDSQQRHEGPARGGRGNPLRLIGSIIVYEKDAAKKKAAGGCLLPACEPIKPTCAGCRTSG